MISRQSSFEIWPAETEYIDSFSETIGKRFKRIIFASVVIFGLSGSSIGTFFFLFLISPVSSAVQMSPGISFFWSPHRAKHRRSSRSKLSFQFQVKNLHLFKQPFPRVMLCLNSMHSKEKLRRYYPKLEKILGLLYYNMELNEETLNKMKSGLMTGIIWQCYWQVYWMILPYVYTIYQSFKSTVTEKCTKTSFPSSTYSDRQRCGSSSPKQALISKFQPVALDQLIVLLDGETTTSKKENAKATLDQQQKRLISVRIWKRKTNVEYHL